MEIAIEKKNLADMDLIKGLRWEVGAIKNELRSLQDGIGVYDMEIDRLTNEIQQLENKSHPSTLDFVVCIREIDRVKSALDTYRQEHFSRHEKEKDRIKELLQMEKVAKDRLNDFVILDVRDVLSV